MKKRDLTELRNSGREAVGGRLSKTRKDFEEARVKMLGGQETNLKLAANLRRDIAQLKTLMKEMPEEVKKEIKAKERTKTKK